MVDAARYFVSFLTEESCGKCVPCREGLRTSLDILNRISFGNGREEDIDLLEEIGGIMQDCCLCALGTSATNPVMTTIRYFREEYGAHIHQKKCPAGVCKDLIEYFVNADLCDGCHSCAVVCSTDAIIGEKKQKHSIVHGKCIKCGACLEVCKQEAILTT
jgi:Pyruvate/2-oxoacid:ferredoxin oxidoreductase delta subunit